MRFFCCPSLTNSCFACTHWEHLAILWGKAFIHMFFYSSCVFIVTHSYSLWLIFLSSWMIKGISSSISIFCVCSFFHVWFSRETTERHMLKNASGFARMFHIYNKWCGKFSISKYTQIFTLTFMHALFTNDSHSLQLFMHTHRGWKSSKRIHLKKNESMS